MHRLLPAFCVLAFLILAGCSRDSAQLTGPDSDGQVVAAPNEDAIRGALSVESDGETYERYVVVLNSGATKSQRDALMAPLRKAQDQVYNTVYKGFAGYLTKAETASLKASPLVRILEKDGYVYAADALTPDQIMEQAAPWVPLGLMPETDSPEVVKYLSAQTQDWGVQRIGATLNTGNRGTGVTVAIIDTGCDLTHSDLAGGYLYQGGQPISYNAIYPSRPADDGQGHGTHCAGIIGARDNTFGTIGVAPDCNLLAVKVLSDRGWGLNSWVISGIDWTAANAATYNIRVGSLSLGGGFHAATNAAIDSGTALGMTYCVAAGNSYANSSGFSPASAAEAICVSSLQNGTTNPATDYFSTFSNWGTTVEVIAPGTSIFAPFRGNRYATLSGTSMACPHAAGCCALWFSTHTGSGGTGNRADCLAALQAQGFPGPAGGWPTVPAQGRPDPDGVGEPLVKAQFLSAPPPPP
jgi:subtilisin